jgi:hypothetical protein
MSEVDSVQEPKFAAWVGIDWADRKHVWCLQSAGSEQRERGELEHSPEAVKGLGRSAVSTICQSSDRGGGGAIAGSSGVHARQV